jgi:translation initiation factor IF-1
VSKEDLLEMEGTIIEVLPNQMFKVEIKEDYVVTCYTSGKMRQHKIRLVTGDQVIIEMSTYDLNKGRIVYRHA